MAVAAARPVAIKIDEDTKARVKRLADARQRTPHWLMREAITQYVNREEKREAFRQDVKVLILQPDIGRPVGDMDDEFRDWTIDFGDSGYVARNRLDAEKEIILAVRHQKEAVF